MAHLSDVVIYQGSQSPANYSILVVSYRRSSNARCTLSFEKHAQTSRLSSLMDCAAPAEAVVWGQQLLQQTE